jgi:hypothetical protein
MTNVTRLTLATLLMGSLALPALAQDVSSQSPATAAPASTVSKHAPAMKISDASVKPGLHTGARTGVHKAAAGSEIPGSVAKPGPGAAATTTTAVPSKDIKAKDASPVTGTVTGKETTKTPAAAPATKAN